MCVCMCMCTNFTRFICLLISKKLYYYLIIITISNKVINYIILVEY